MTGAPRHFPFAQFEFPWALGPADGRYVVRVGVADAPRHVLVLATLGAPERRSLRGRRGRAAPPGPPPSPVTTARATIVGAEPFAGEAQARAWLARHGSGEDAAAWADEALRVLNTALRAHRVAAADPYVREVAAEQALVARLGYGEGEQVADGRWTEAVELPARRARERRTAALRPQERLAALLGGRDAVLACEELTLRARLDLDQGRPREAALQLSGALAAAVGELAPWRARRDMAARIEELRELAGPAREAADAAASGALEPGHVDLVETALGRVEAALRARTALGID